MTTRTVHIGDIISVTSGRLVSRDGMSGVHEFLEFMAGEDVWTHQLPRVAQECTPWLTERFPDLAAIEVPADLSPVTYEAWIAEQEQRFGVTREVEPLKAGEHTHRNPFQELVELLPPGGKILPVVVGDAP